MSDISKVISKIKSMHIHVGHSGIKYDRNDMFLLHFDDAVDVAGVYTRSSITSPTIGWCRNITAKGKAKALIVNSGNANTMTGQHGLDAISHVSESYAKLLGCQADEILVNSTGVIGEPLPYEKIIDALPKALAEEASIEDAAQAIMTTDLKSKIAHQVCKIDKRSVNLVAIAKGSGMCAPNMATVLCYIITDATIPAPVLDKLLRRSIDKSLNCVTVDSDRSTNDSTIMFATGTGSKHKHIGSADDNAIADFAEALDILLIDIAKQLAADGEGATKLIEINVRNCKNSKDSKVIGRSVAESPLVKTAIFGNDPNWGRIAMAIGKANKPVDLKTLQISIGGYVVFAEDKNQMDEAREADLVQYLSESKHVLIDIDLGFKNSESNCATFYSSDLTEEYIRINTAYRS